VIRVEVSFSEPPGKVPESAFAGAEAAGTVRHVHESVRDMAHSWPSFQLWEVVTNYNNGRFQIRQGRVTKDWVRALDHRAKLYLHPGSVVVVGFENRNPDRPYIRGIYGVGRLARQFSPLTGIWLQGQGQPSLAARSPSPNVLVTVGEGATDLGAIAAAETVFQEASLGLVVGSLNGTPMIVWLVGGSAGGRYTNRLYALQLSDFSPVWQLDLPAGHLSPADTAYDGSNLFLDEASGFLFALGRGGTDRRRVSVVDGRGSLVDTKLTSWELTNTSVASSRIVRGWHTQRDYDGRSQRDPLIRSWEFRDSGIVDGWSYDPRTFFADLRDSEAASANSTGGRWPVNPVTGQLVVWQSGWLVPDTNGEDAYLSRGFTKTSVGPFPQDPAYTPTAITRDGPHRFQRAGVVAIDLVTGVVASHWTTDNDSAYHQMDTTSIAAWDSYRSGTTPNATPGVTHSPSGGHVYVTFADHQSIDLGLAGDTLVTGDSTTQTSTCPGEDPGPIETDETQSWAPYVEPAYGNHGGFGTTQSSNSFLWPDYKWFTGHQLLLPYEGGARLPSEDDKGEDGMAIAGWGDIDSFLNADPVGGCLAPDSSGFTYVAHIEQEGFIVGSSALLPAFPIQNDPDVVTVDLPCPGGQPGATTLVETTYSVTWFTYQVGAVQHTCKTWLTKLDSGMAEVWKVDATRRFDLLIDGPPGAGPSTADQQRGAGDNAYQIEPVPQVGKLLWLRDTRDRLYPTDPGGIDHLPYRGIEVRDLSDGSLIEMLVSSEALDEVTIGSDPFRKWAECGWNDGPTTHVQSPPERRSGVDADGLPWVMWFFDVQLRESDGTKTVMHRAWRIYWGDGLGSPPRNEIQDYTSHDFPGGLLEVIQLALAADLAIWPSSNYDSMAGTYSLLALRLP
jgi:hypothetical protein